MILDPNDPNGIASSTGEITLTEAVEDDGRARRRSASEERVSMLLFRAGGGAPKAVPLALVARLEDIDATTIEFSNDQMVVQYRGKLMPLIPFDGGMSLAADGTGRKPVLVFSDRDRSMGLVVDEIVDIVEQDLHVEMAGERPGLLGSAIVAGKATDIIDAGYWLTQAYQDWFATSKESFEEELRTERVLLVDDSPFFRNMLTPLLTVAGYDVTTVESANQALELCEGGEQFDIIVSDIEMPGMNGFDFARAVKDSDRWSRTPIVALSSHASSRDLDRGRAAGFTDYVAKFDRDALLNALSMTLSTGEADDETRGAA